MLFRWLARLWHWLTEAEPWNRHAPYPHGDPPAKNWGDAVSETRRDERNGLTWPSEEDD